MNTEIKQLITLLQESYEGDPWSGKPVTALLSEVPESIAFEKPNGQHSIVELIWHMVNWREFAISRLQPSEEKDLPYFEANDWREIDPANKNLWQEGVTTLQQTQQQLINLLSEKKDDFLSQKVSERHYTYRKLLNGVIQHDTYHLGQIAYIIKLYKA